MGQLLSHPILEKTIESKDHESVSYCVGSMQGYRMTMEDAHNIMINSDETVAVFGVFDGHGGRECAQHLSETLPKNIMEQLSRLYGASLRENMRTIKDLFFRADHEVAGIPNSLNCGSTAIIATIVKDKYIIVSNTGDSRCILSVNGNAKTLSFDHKPAIMNERIRIENGNGYILNNRVNEILALSRAVGDFKFKFPYLDGSNNVYINKNAKYFTNGFVRIPPELYQVSCEPDLLVYDLNNGRPEFIVVACDGIWDCYRNSELITLIRNKLGLGWHLNRIIEFILDDSLQRANSYTGIGFDNMTLIIIAIHDGEMDDWYELMRKTIISEKHIL